MRSRLRAFFVLATLLLGLFAFLRLAEWSSRGGSDTPLYSLRRHDPYGCAALGELLSRRGVPVETLERPRLKEGTRGVLIQVLPVQQWSFWQAITDPRRYLVHKEDLRDWIARGNTVVQFSRERTELMSHLSVPKDSKGASQGSQAPEIQELQVKGRAPDDLPVSMESAEWLPAAGEALGLATAEIGSLVIRDPLHFGEKGTMDWRPLARSKRGVVAGEFRFGEGRLVVVGAPTPMLNEGLAEGGNLDFLLALVGQGPVIFDEWSHGIGHVGNVIGLIKEVGLVPVIIQILFALVLYGWSVRGHRRPKDEEVRRKRSSVEQIKTLGLLYSRTLSDKEAGLRVVQEVRSRLAAALRCPITELEQRCGSLPPKTAERTRNLLGALPEDVRQPQKESDRLSEAELAKALTRSHQILKEITRERRTFGRT